MQASCTELCLKQVIICSSEVGECSCEIDPSESYPYDPILGFNEICNIAFFSVEADVGCASTNEQYAIMRR